MGVLEMKHVKSTLRLSAKRFLFPLQNAQYLHNGQIFCELSVYLCSNYVLIAEHMKKTGSFNLTLFEFTVSDNV